MKFRKLPVVIEAEQYKPGMEDGFDTFFMDCVGNISMIQSEQYPTPVNVPFINTSLGKHYLTETNQEAKTIRPIYLWEKTED